MMSVECIRELYHASAAGHNVLYDAEPTKQCQATIYTGSIKIQRVVNDGFHGGRVVGGQIFKYR
jgi:hypothetical protein